MVVVVVAGMEAKYNGGTACSASLTSKPINGTVSLNEGAPSGAAVQVLVLAEDHMTDHLENVTLVSIPSHLTSPIPFSIKVPTCSSLATTPPPAPTCTGSFDLIAAAQD